MPKRCGYPPKLNQNKIQSLHSNRSLFYGVPVFFQRLGLETLILRSDQVVMLHDAARLVSQSSFMSHYFSVARKGVLLAWFALIAFCGVYYLIHPEVFTAEYLAASLLNHKEKLVAIYALLSVVRGFTLLPSTPLVLAGALIFPRQPFLVLFISMAGILASSAMIYYFADRLGLNDYFAHKYPKKMGQIRERLERPSGLLFLLFWAFFPVVPTDLASYVAGVIRMNFWKFIAVVFLGELVLCWACIWGIGLI